jgi:hypothetical protein
VQLEITSRGRRNRYTLHLETLGQKRPAAAPTPDRDDRTHPITVIGSPPVSPSSDRTQINDPPVVPQGGPSRFRVRFSKTESRTPEPQPPVETRASQPSSDTVSRVLAYFLAKLWPDAMGPADSRNRRRLVRSRLRELQAGKHAEEAEQVLLDAVDGARLHPWHRLADLGFHARHVFRDLDKVEELAALGRRKRLADERARLREQGPEPRRADPPPIAQDSNCAGWSDVLAALNELDMDAPRTACDAGELAELTAARDRALARPGRAA